MLDSEINKDTFPKYKPNPLFIGMPAYLKDPNNYVKIQKELLDALATTHSHSDVKKWSECFNCQIRVKTHRELMLKLGFKNGKQYMGWKKIMDIIINKKRIPLR